MTNRLSQLVCKLALQGSGRSAERLCALLHIAVSDTTLGRLLQKLPLPDAIMPKVLGVDDWALKKRHCYGTILVDLECHQIIDLLKDREAETLQQWLQDHPGIQVVSRDRFTNYFNAVTAALPECTQVADRWHLLKNLCDDLKKLIERNHQHLKYAQKKEIRRLQKERFTQLIHKRKQEEASSHPAVNCSLRWQQFRQIKRLQKKGVPILKIARTLNMSRNTVKKYLHLSEPPKRKHSFQVNIAAFDTYIKNRIKEEPDIQLMKLFKEIKQLGYNGGRTSAFDHLHAYVNRPPRSNIPRLPDVFYLPSKIPFLLLRKWDQLNSKEQSLLKNLCKECPQIKVASSLAIECKQIMENKKGNLLKRWLKKAVATGIRELKSFTKGLLPDFTAVKNALTLPWSNGQVEGQINKLKTIKRQMYGRASFDLLRKRLLLNTG